MNEAGISWPWAGVVETAVQEALGSESSGHDGQHAFRVRNLASHLARLVGADREVVEAAALLHDIGHEHGRKNHAKRGARLAAKILECAPFPKEKASAVLECIEHHHWLPNRSGDPTNPTLEYRVFADADRLDALGAIGIARTFAFGGVHKRPIWHPQAGTGSNSPYGPSSIQHFYDKLLLLECDMYTEPAQQLAARRILTLREFLRTFFSEWSLQDLIDTASLTSLDAADAPHKDPRSPGGRPRSISGSLTNLGPITIV